MNLLSLLQQRFQTALTGLAADPAKHSLLVKPAQDARFGDYQANCAMPLAKELGQKPRDIAQTIVDRLPKDDLLEPPEIAGPGFINLRFTSDWLAAQVQRMAVDPRLGVAPAAAPRTIVVDFSSPNVAKPMHVGHLRSTIIGDALARLFRFLGHKVITDNHLGDWGTQFGMLLYGYKHFRDDAALKADPVREMSRLYKEVRKLIKPSEPSDETPGQLAEKYTDQEVAQARLVADAARNETAKLHALDAENFELWKQFQPWCLGAIDPIYKDLDIHFDYTLGESFYNPQLPEVVSELQNKGIAQESQGALAIFFGEKETPTLVRKRDGAFTYTTTDLATIRYRAANWKPSAILYVVDFRQSLHFKQLFDAARRWGFEDLGLHHISFGSVLGEDGKPLKAREGDATELSHLLRESVIKAGQKYEQSRTEREARGLPVADVSAAEKQQIAEVVGRGAVKYADLCQNRTSDYTFSWDKMLATEGNTATYMQYSYARVRSIFREGDEDPAIYRTHPPLPFLEKLQERALALQLLRFEEILQSSANEFLPSTITAYLWDVSKAANVFYHDCPVLTAETPALRHSRLLLCDLTGRVIQKGLDLLGIRTVERM